MKQAFLAASAQISPVYLELGPTVAKVCRTIREVGARGAELAVFPEVVIPGYPYWRGLYPISEWTKWMLRYQANSLAIPSPETEQLCEAARAARCFCVIGCSERTRLAGSETLYNTALFIDEDGRIVGKHRKLMPTHGERMVWGMGDGSDLQVLDTSLGRIGALICYEHHMTLLKAALASLGEEIHCALWAGYWVMEGHPGAKRRWRPGDSADLCEVAYANRAYAFESQNFVVSAGNYDPADSLPAECRGWDIGSGGSAILNPAGLYLAGPSLDREEILYAELRAEDRFATKAYIDTLGHYSRFDVVSLRLNKGKLTPLEDSAAQPEAASSVVRSGIPALDAADTASRDNATDPEAATTSLHSTPRTSGSTPPTGHVRSVASRRGSRPAAAPSGDQPATDPGAVQSLTSSRGGWPAARRTPSLASRRGSRQAAAPSGDQPATDPGAVQSLMSFRGSPSAVRRARSVASPRGSLPAAGRSPAKRAADPAGAQPASSPNAPPTPRPRTATRRARPAVAPGGLSQD